MAHVHKPTYTAPIPTGAKIVTRKDQRLARFKRKGRMVEAPLTDDGQKCRLETAEWYVRYKTADGKWKREKGYTDRQATDALATRLEKGVARNREGLTDPFEKHRRRPLLDHLDDHRTTLAARNCTPEHTYQVISRATRIINGCGFEHMDDLSASSVQAFLAELREGGISAQTSNHYLRAIKQFSRWLRMDRRTSDDPLVHLSMLNVQTDRRHDRRALDHDDFAKLVDAAMTGPVIATMAGPDRAMLYVLAAWTGFRRKELASLTIGSFDLTSQTPSVRVEACYAKNRRQDEVPLHAAVVERLAVWLADHDFDPDEPIFKLRMPSGRLRCTADMMRRDCGRAGIPYQDESGLFADFHSHRHTFISALGKAGTPLATAQKLARHSDPKLTANVYTHLGLADKASAIEALPAPPDSTACHSLAIDNSQHGTAWHKDYVARGA